MQTVEILKTQLTLRLSIFHLPNNINVALDSFSVHAIKRLHISETVSCIVTLQS